MTRRAGGRYFSEHGRPKAPSPRAERSTGRRRSRRKVRLDERMRIGSRMRDRLGMLCATGAVACLASITAQWSQELPVQRSPWERELFGDLSVPAAPQVLKAPAALTGTPIERSAHPPSLEEPITIPDTLPPADVPLVGIASPVPSERELRAVEPLLRVIQTVRHQQSDDTPTAWLSGGIELLDDDSTPTSQPGTRYFPEAHRDQAWRQDIGR
jgi:hypothetical protein